LRHERNAGERRDDWRTRRGQYDPN
jgi:hypothetical protein